MVAHRNGQTRDESEAKIVHQTSYHSARNDIGVNDTCENNNISLLYLFQQPHDRWQLYETDHDY